MKKRNSSKLIKTLLLTLVLSSAAIPQRSEALIVGLLRNNTTLLLLSIPSIIFIFPVGLVLGENNYSSVNIDNPEDPARNLESIFPFLENTMESRLLAQLIEDRKDQAIPFSSERAGEMNMDLFSININADEVYDIMSYGDYSEEEIGVVVNYLTL